MVLTATGPFPVTGSLKENKILTRGYGKKEVGGGAHMASSSKYVEQGETVPAASLSNKKILMKENHRINLTKLEDSLTYAG